MKQNFKFLKNNSQGIFKKTRNKKEKNKDDFPIPTKKIHAIFLFQNFNFRF